jgi:hypothetical protein
MSVRLWPAGGIPPWRRGFPFFLAEPRSAVERLRAAGARQAWTHGSPWKRWALGCAMTAGWPVVTFIDSLKLSARRAKWGGQAGFMATFADLYRAALWRNIPPNQYAMHVSFGVEPDRLADFLMPLDLRALQRLSIAQGARPRDVQDKARFEEICRGLGLPCVPTVAAFDHGVSTGEDKLRKWKAPLFVKALSGNRGAGAELWQPGVRGFVSSSGQELTLDELIDRLRPENCIVQPVLEDHPALRAFGTVALSNIRLITAKAGETPAVPIAASLSLAVEEGSLTGHAGIHCGIDIATGTITGTSRSVEEDDRLAGRDIAGFAVPDWKACVTIACKAHDEAFPAFTTLGWDVALTATGPVLLEANVDWRIVGHQKLTGPLGQTALAGVIDALLAPAKADRSPEGLPPGQAVRSPSPAPRAGRGPSGAGNRTPRHRAAKGS